MLERNYRGKVLGHRRIGHREDLRRDRERDGGSWTSGGRYVRHVEEARGLPEVDDIVEGFVVVADRCVGHRDEGSNRSWRVSKMVIKGTRIVMRMERTSRFVEREMDCGRRQVRAVGDADREEDGEDV